MSLGNQKPELLSCVETALWKTFLRIASGSPITSEMARFYGTFKTIKDSVQCRPEDATWFNSSECLCLLTQLNIFN